MNVQQTVEGPGDPDQSADGQAATGNQLSSAQPTPEFRVGGQAARYIAVALLAGALFFVIGLFASLSSRGVPSFSEIPSMTQCTSETLAQLDLKQPPTPAILRQSVDYCYSLMHSQELLKDFAIRKLNFIQQYHANEILLWMVVIITLSGVALAGLQVLASYRLAESNNQAPATNDEISLQRDRIVLKSSVTGLFILLLSFAFFLVFVLYVYRFEKWHDEDASKPQQAVTLPPGGLGEPPSKEPQQDVTEKSVQTRPSKRP
ncbi:hypothetical protein [Methylocystis hirsuta]|uniref:hypothetical protein n=1 Tax=Methylocystis hirsuta TaxID=369798 RepID=UPI0011CEB0FD|nr:hypothetical protein [Methylocystis hirsuta]